MPVRISTIKKSTNNKCWRECGEKGTTQHCWWEYKLVHPLEEQYAGSLKKQKTKIELPHDPAILLLGIYQDKL